MINAQSLIDAANQRLKAGKIRIRLEIQGKGDWIYVRGTFPAQPWEPNQTKRQRRIALNLRAVDRQTVKRAEIIAKKIDVDLSQNTFDWRKFTDFRDPNEKTIAQWCAELEAHWWQGKDRNDPSKKVTWYNGYSVLLRKLPQDAPLTPEVIQRWIEANSKPNSQQRRNYLICARALARLAELPTEPYRKAVQEIKTKVINPRDLPSDEEIVQIWRAIPEDGWRYAFGMLAAYGLRPHELFFLDCANFPIVRVRQTAKTGARPVKPLYPEWVDIFGLKDGSLPDLPVTPKTGNQRMGKHITKYFRENLPVRAYDLRHCYSRRCTELNITPDLAARLMGHSEHVHRTIYKAWVGERVYLDAVDRILARPDRPSAPKSD